MLKISERIKGGKHRLLWMSKMNLKKISENIWEIPKERKMNVPGRVFASDKLMERIKEDKTLEQIKNAGMLPGIVKYSIAMPDAHQGYGLCVGGVIAFNLKNGIVSPGATGYDINCGVRLLSSEIKKEEFLKKRKEITHQIKRDVPSGVGRGGELKFTDKEIDEILKKGVKYFVEKGIGKKSDIEYCEDNGCILGANPEKISQRAKARGRNQLGTIGAGNHFLEIQEIEKIYDEKTAKVFGLKQGNICVLIHSGSRGLGHQTCSDYLKICEKEYGINHLPDRELAYAPIDSKIGKDYIEAMRASANFAFCNRHLIAHLAKKAFSKFFPKKELELVYDVAHNIIKFEEFQLNGKKTELCVHRKGATRSFGIGRKELPKKYQKTGQPILIPGSMGTYSYVLVGTEKAREISFASTAHGAGRILSRTEAKKRFSPEFVKNELEKNDVYIEAGSVNGMVEEAPSAYKDVNEVVKVSHELGIGNIVARLKPLAVIKG